MGLPKFKCSVICLILWCFHYEFSYSVVSLKIVFILMIYIYIKDYLYEQWKISPAVGQKAVSVSSAKLWNSIPINIRNSNTIVTFKSHMFQHLNLSTNNHMGTNPNLSNKNGTFVSSSTQSAVTNVVIQINEVRIITNNVKNYYPLRIINICIFL